MKLPLYLGSQAEVWLDAGPSLVVRSPGYALGRYPLQRISRVNVYQGAIMPLSVMATCLANNISITIMDAKGRALGVCFGLGQKREEPAAVRIEGMLTRPDWQGHYINLRDAEIRRAVITMLKRMKLRAPDLRPNIVRSFLCQCAGKAGLPATHFQFNLDHWHGMATSLAQARLRALCGAPLPLVQPSCSWNLPRDVADIVIWDMCEYMMLEIRRWCKAVALSESMHVGLLAAAFEQRTPRLDNLIHAFWTRFLAWLEEEETWRRPLDI